MKTRAHFQFEVLPSKKRTRIFRVMVTRPDGMVEVLGTITEFYIRHIGRFGWEAMAADGHLGVHEQSWQAAFALSLARPASHTWVPPFPVAQSKRRLLSGEFPADAG